MHDSRPRFRVSILLLLVPPLLGWASPATGSGDPLASAWGDLLEAAEKAGQELDFETEQRHLETALQRAQQAGASPSEIGDILDRLGETYRCQKKYRKAEETLVRALMLKEEALGEGHPSTAATLEQLSTLEEHRGYREKSEEYLFEALRIREEALGTNHPDLAETLILLGLTRELDGRFEEAEAYLQRALAIRERALGEDHPLIAEVLPLLAGLYEETGRPEEARKAEARTWAIWDKEEKKASAPPPQR